MFDKTIKMVCAALLGPLLLAPAMLRAQSVAEETSNAHVQATYVWQAKPAFAAAYSGANSLGTAHQDSYSFSATAAFGVRPWQGGEAYLDTELVQGVPLSGLTGLGGMTNGEQQKTGGPNPTLYRARLFLRQTMNLAGPSDAVASDANQLAGQLARRRLVLTVGNLAVTDMFDNNSFAHDGRSQFMNWALVAQGAYDFAADARGYTWGAAIEYVDEDWAVRAGRFMQPAESNGLALDRRMATHYGDQIELEHGHTLAGQAGRVRLLLFRNRARMGAFRDALAAADGAAPQLAPVRKDQSKRGVGLNVEQALSADVGVFARAGWNDGASETYAFAEIDRSASAGALVQGARWGRPQDTLGIALVRDGISSAHRDFLGAGGLGAFVGDGALSYRAERIVEAFYSIAVAAHGWLTFDGQRIDNPAYNAARGPVNVASVRLHAQY